MFHLSVISSSSTESRIQEISNFIWFTPVRVSNLCGVEKFEVVLTIALLLVADGTVLLFLRYHSNSES